MAGPSRRYSNVLGKPPVVNAMSSKVAYYNDLGRTYGPVAAAAYEKFGLEPWQKRSNLLPYYSKDTGWVAPQIVYSAAKAALSPGVAATGHRVGPDEAMNFALTAVGSGQVGSISTGGIPAGSVGMNAYHGSPHKFDKFDLSKVGTGEGAQAYGHGIYLAESPGVAKSYQTKLATNQVFLDGAAVSPPRSATDPASLGLNALRMEPTPAAAATELRKAVADESLWGAGSQYANRSAYAAAADWLDKNAARIEVESGHLYHVDLPDSTISKMLDWDKPLSEQPAILAKIKDMLDPAHVNFDMLPQMTGKDIMSMDGPMSTYLGPGRSPHELSRILLADGIPGIKYLDAGSRGAQEGTRNFVVFDPGTVKIIKRE